MRLDTMDEIFLPGFIQPNYNLGRLKGSTCDTLTGINNIVAFHPALDIYPNPSKSSFTISSSEKGIVTVCDILGRTLLTAQIEPGNTVINAYPWPPGMYIVTVKYPNGFVVNKKFVKE
jgi:hypothetical protein